MRVIFYLIVVFCSFSIQSQDKTVKKDSVPKLNILGRFNFILNQSAFSNWTSGGENTVAGEVNVNYDFNYKKDNIAWNTRIQANYGLSYLEDKGYRKTNDRFELNSVFGLRKSKTWYLSFITNFRTQFTIGYNYSKEPPLPISNVLSPAYLTFGPGFLWKKSNDLNINFSPFTGRYTFVSREFSGRFGVPLGETVLTSLGFNISAYYKFMLMENIEMENILTSFSDYLHSPQNIDIDYQINFRFIVNQFVKMNLSLHTIMDNDASASIQFRQLFGFGLAFDFHKNIIY